MFWFLITIILLFLLILSRKKDSIANPLEERILTLLKIYIKQMVRWGYASSQDSNPLIAIIHANYAVSYLMIIKDYMMNFNISRELFYKLTKTNFYELEQKILNIQDRSLRKLFKIDKNNILSRMFINDENV